MGYVANYASESVTPIRLADGQAGPPIAAGKIPARLAVSPDGNTVYVLDSNIFGGMGPGIPFRMLFRMLLRRPPLRAGPGHSDPCRDQLRREAHKGGPAPDCHRDHLLNRAGQAGRASQGLVLLSAGQRTVPPGQPQDEPRQEGRKPMTLLRYRGIAVRLG